MNGMMVRQERISGPTLVADLDELQIGSVRLVIRELHSAAPTQTV